MVSVTRGGSSYVTVTDQFCGAGGSSLGAVACGAEVKLALNHWARAIETHQTNFPDTAHDCTDVSACDPRRYGSTDILITSPECTDHTLAKGKKRKGMAQMDLWGKTMIDPAEERSRATMWDVCRFAEHHHYNIVITENVVDAALYWPLFEVWLQAMMVLGYDYEIVCLNSMFAHPTPQSRDRLYVVFWRKGNKQPNLTFAPSAWCPKCQVNVASVQVWKRTAVTRGRFKVGKYGHHGQYVYRCPQCQEQVTPYYYCAATAIDWSVLGERIGDRKKPLKPRTMERITYGLKKFAGHTVALRYAGSKIRPLTDPLPTQTTRQEKALIVPPYLMGIHGDYYTFRGLDEVTPTCVGSASTTALIAPPYLVSTNYFSDRNREMEEPLPTQTTKQPYGLATPPAGAFVVEEKNHHNGRAVTEPLGTVIAGGNHHYVVRPPMVIGQQGGAVARPVTEELPTVATGGAISLVTPPPFLVSANHRQMRAVDVADALPTQTADLGYDLVSPPPFLVDYYGDRHATKPITDPAGTVSSFDNHALIVPAGGTWSENVASAQHEPYPTQITRESNGVAFLPHMMVPYYGTSEPRPIEEPTRSVTTHDREALCSVEVAVEDCRFRMLQPNEIQAAMAFPHTYKVLGTQREKIKQLGNALTPPVMHLLLTRCIETLAG